MQHIKKDIHQLGEPADHSQAITTITNKSTSLCQLAKLLLMYSTRDPYLTWLGTKEPVWNISWASYVFRKWKLFQLTPLFVVSNSKVSVTQATVPSQLQDPLPDYTIST